MKRRDFLRNLSLLTAGAVIAPAIIVELEKEAPRHIGVGIEIDSSTKIIKLVDNPLVNSGGVTLGDLYSFMKEEWKNDEELMVFPFPFEPIDDKTKIAIKNVVWEFSDES